ncbi:MAG: cupredoxin domain-containing protein [Gemmatimonadetes bacterium]|nr:cupredoxin domain-containing protein [Gemmatimonadota bacterium]NIQ54779.1 cupredoxin domain-containing protein [Gemmatimonadota bacterium]NIW36490.1 cupredoxin domain-containing protein [Gemmatimonadota bacterium]NIX44857.1 cupredoxin domain-containing protein [Gemmatimonadota bacterium]NIY09095.1 cupredoxin domain-containing protein [Gemmatimonadota bacterium]
MSIDVILVDIAALLTVTWIVWYFWLSESRASVAAAVAGVQEAAIRVKGGYDPDRIEVRAGEPVRLTFLRQETAACSERVEFPDFGVSRELPEGEEVTIELTPEPGEYDFTCQMGMLRGTLVARGNGQPS